MKTVLIIGGGVSGLSAGIYARYHGYNAVICERHKLAGGNLTGWTREGYHIDNCIHWLTGTNPNTKTYQTWKELGALGQVDVLQPDVLYTCEKEGQRFSLYRDLDKLQSEMLDLSPADEKQIQKLVQAIRTLQTVSGVRGFSLKDVLSLPTLVPYLRLSTGELSQRFAHPLLQTFFSCFIGTEFSALALLFVFATFCGDNGGLPKGGSLAMAQRMEKRFTSLGGELLLGKEVTEIILQRNSAVGVRFLDGSTLFADYIVCACEPTVTFGKLLKRDMPKALQKQYTTEPRFSSWHCAFACDLSTLPFSGDLILCLDEKEQEILHTKQLIIREFSHEPSFAPKGKNVIQTMVFVDENTAKEFIALKRTPDKYRRKKLALCKAVEKILTARVPAFSNKLRPLDVWTPATYQRYTLSPTGSYMSFILRKNKLPAAKSAWISGIKNVLLATQWQQAPGGLPTAADMGKRAIAQIVRKDARAIKLPIFSKKRKARV
ncbi:MAG: NAD(P)/FAD-dependent oxidoreductase [Clostridia bacterium]|nr:NAD(P)/FAD-dependent oxidoreductase [Clostridia bacterium]